MGTSLYYNIEPMYMDVNGEGQDETVVAFENNDTHKKTKRGVWNFF